MNSIKVLHTADIHLSNINDDTYETFCRIISYVKSKNIECLLISGDLFDKNPDIKLALKVNDLFAYINSCKIFISPGNHDPYTFDSVYNSNIWSSNVHIFKDNLSYYTYDNVRIYGCAFKGHFEKTSILTPISTDDRFINILVIHGDIDSPSSLYNPITLNDLKRSNFDYCALGHIHKRIAVNPYVYPGTPQGRGFDETGDLGVTIATIAKGKYETEHISMCKKRYVIEELDISDVNSTSEIYDKIKDNITKINDYYRIILKGNVSNTPDVTGITTLLKPYYNHIEVIDKTVISYNLETLKKENSLKGIFVRNMLTLINQNPDDNTLIDSLNIGLKAFEYDIEVGDSN